MENLSRILAEHPVLKGLQSQYLDLLVGCASNVRFNAGDFVFREGDEADRFYLIRSGNVVLEICTPTGPVEVHTKREGDILGWAWLSPPYRWFWDARAVEPTRAFAFDGKCLRTKCEQNKDLGYEFMKRTLALMVEEFEAAQMKLVEATIKEV